MDIAKLVLVGWCVGIMLPAHAGAQCDIAISKCFPDLQQNKNLYCFIENLLDREPQKQKIYLQENFRYTFSYCTAPGLGEMVVGLQELDGTLLIHNIAQTDEVKNHLTWECKRTGFYHLIYWLEEGAGCIAVQVSIQVPDKP